MQSGWDELWEYTTSLANGLPCPVTIEPPVIKDLQPRVRGVIRSSPAGMAGLRKDDIINSVDGNQCISRVDAFFKVRSGGRVSLEVFTDGLLLDLVVDKEPGCPSGLVMDYDIDPRIVANIKRTAGKYREVNLLCSVLGAPVLTLALHDLVGEPDSGFTLTPVNNECFGGSIMSAGLLTVPDFLAAVTQTRNYHTSSGTRASRAPQVLFVPEVAFDGKGRDLVGNSCLRIGEETGLKVEVI
ncbi:MAG: hypothetical protein ACYC21_00570 [Eubacteriales bacterium]